MTEVETYYNRGTYYPTVDVKLHVWADTIPWDTLAEEFDNALEVKQWLADCENTKHREWGTLADRYLYAALEWAQESAWDDAREEAIDIFGSHAKVYGEGRQGGHLVVHGIGQPEEWGEEVCAVCTEDDYCYDLDHEAKWKPDEQAFKDWHEFKERIEAIRDYIPYQTGWNIIVNIYEPILDGLREAI